MGERRADDAHYDAVLTAYEAHLATLDQGGAVATFATSISLNDAWFNKLTIDSKARTVTLLLLTGDLQTGYWRTTLIYAGAEVVEGESVLRAAVGNAAVEIWYDEFVCEGGQMSHGVLLTSTDGAFEADAGEYRIAFSAFSWSQEPVPGRVLS